MLCLIWGDNFFILVGLQGLIDVDVLPVAACFGTND